MWVGVGNQREEGGVCKFGSVGEQRKEGGGCKGGWEWENRGKMERDVDVGGSGGAEGRGRGVVNVSGNGGTEKRGRGLEMWVGMEEQREEGGGCKGG